MVFGEASGFLGLGEEFVLFIQCCVVFLYGSAVASFGVVADFYWFSKGEEVADVFGGIRGVGKVGEPLGLGFELVGA